MKTSRILISPFSYFFFFLFLFNLFRELGTFFFFSLRCEITWGESLSNEIFRNGDFRGEETAEGPVTSKETGKEVQRDKSDGAGAV